jgi:hypothetical protein
MCDVLHTRALCRWMLKVSLSDRTSFGSLWRQHKGADQQV